MNEELVHCSRIYLELLTFSILTMKKYSEKIQNNKKLKQKNKMLLKGKTAMWFLIIITIIGIFSGEIDLVIQLWVVSGILTLGGIIFNQIKDFLSKK